MNHVLKKIKNISLLCFFFMLIMQVRPAYSIPSSLEEFQQMFGNLCYEYGLDFCASPPKSEEEGNKRKEFTETEKQILTRLSRQQSRMQEREMDMDRREQQLKALQEDVQRQISQLENFSRKLKETLKARKHRMMRSSIKRSVFMLKWMQQQLHSRSISLKPKLLCPS